MNNNAIGQSWDDFEKVLYRRRNYKERFESRSDGERIKAGNEKELTLGQKVAIVPNKQE